MRNIMPRALAELSLLGPDFSYFVVRCRFSLATLNNGSRVGSLYLPAGQTRPFLAGLE